MASHFTLSLSLNLTFILFLILAINTSSSSEPDFLLTFKSAIDDPLNHLSSWSNTSTTHHCNWTGIACAGTGDTVSSINLQALNLSGEISPSVCRLSDLVMLNLADNFFNQPIPLHLSQCSSLNTLNLSSNLIWGTIPDQISEFKSLKVLDLSKNHVEGKIPDGVGSLKNLQVLNLESNSLSGSIPSVLANFTELILLDLSLNPFMEGEIPSDIGKLTKLEHLSLQRSGFHGEIPASIVDMKALTLLDLSQNNLTGVLPSGIGNSLQNLIFFDVSQNNLFGSFPDRICEASRLTSLTLHTNNFNGTLPSTAIVNCLNLERLELQNNGFHGVFPVNLWSLPKIKLIRAENNHFSGEIPDSISTSTQLEQVQIDNNSFISRIPHGLGLVKTLYRFSASLNGLYGEIPPNFCDSPVMSIINFSHNYISGEIPEVKKCKKLVSLSLADNNLIGEIPVSLGGLPVLTYLDLSHNNLTGAIPLELQSLKLALFNVSFNKLSGTVPSSLILGLPASYVQGNPDLCGPGLSNTCSNDDSKRKSVSKLACALISIALLTVILSLVFGFYVVLRSFKRKSEMGIWRSVFFYPLRVTEQDLIVSMDEKACRGGSGGFGRVYVINLPSNELVAVKKILTLGNLSFKSLKTEVKTLAKIRHKNVVRILGFCHSDDSIFLIYECLEKGSLGDLFSKGSELELAWCFRLKIAVGIAQGLAYLHKDYVPHLLHRNIKSKNVLLDEDFEPKITDFALDRILGENAFQSLLDSKSSSCYIAPEFGYNKKATEQMDTYGFGVILLELVTGRPAEQKDSSEDSLDIVKWVRRKVNISNGAIQVLDPKISSSCKKEALGMLEVALECTSVMPEKRPSMGDVLVALRALGSGSRTRLASLGLSSSSHESV